jgi:hypothetical protein
MPMVSQTFFFDPGAAAGGAPNGCPGAGGYGPLGAYPAPETGGG